jgi:protease PrsW
MYHLIFLILLGTLPSLIWLIFFLKKDPNPESRQIITKIFFSGMLAALPAIFIELGLLNFFSKINLPPFLLVVINIFIGVALVEELLKYQVTREKVLIKGKEFDEPIDVIIYMITAALGFAALENILILSSFNSLSLLKEILAVSFLRLVGATLLHALCSGIVGYFLALSFFHLDKKKSLVFSGIAIASLLHGLYNFSIIETEGILTFLIPLAVIITLIILTAFNLKNIKKMKSVCKIK